MDDIDLMSAAAGERNGEVVDAVATSSLVLLIGFRGALGAGLREVIAGDTELRAELADDAGALTATIARRRPHVVLVWHTAISSAVELRRVVLALPEVRVVIAVPQECRERDDALLAAGAVVLPITIERDELRAALRLLARGVVGPPRPAAGNPAAGLGLLTTREAQVLELLAQRRSAVEVAEALHVSVATVNSHRYRIYEKLGVHNRRDLAMYAEELADPDAEPAAPPAASARDRVAYQRTYQQPRERDRAVVIDFCQALGARRWLGRSG